VSGYEEIWLPLVDEPIGSIVAGIQADDAEINRLVNTPRRLLAFRTFAYIRVGILLGQLLVENDIEPYDGTETWVDGLLKDPAHSARVRQEVRAVAEEIANDPKYADDEQLGPDDDARARFREFAKKQLSGLGD
jgi:hypothetical protein